MLEIASFICVCHILPNSTPKPFQTHAKPRLLQEAPCNFKQKIHVVSCLDKNILDTPVVNSWIASTPRNWSRHNRWSRNHPWTIRSHRDLNASGTMWSWMMVHQTCVELIETYISNLQKDVICVCLHLQRWQERRHDGELGICRCCLGCKPHSKKLPVFLAQIFPTASHGPAPGHVLVVCCCGSTCSCCSCFCVPWLKLRMVGVSQLGYSCWIGFRGLAFVEGIVFTLLAQHLVHAKWRLASNIQSQKVIRRNQPTIVYVELGLLEWSGLDLAESERDCYNQTLSEKVRWMFPKIVVPPKSSIK